MSDDRDVGATWNQSGTQQLLTMTISGGGTVEGSGISCTGPATCTKNEPAGSTITLHAVSTATGPTAALMPQRPTIRRAIAVNCSMSDSAPVLISPNTTSSAARPPKATLIFARTSGSR